MGKGVQWHNTQSSDLKTPKGHPAGSWKPTMNGKRNNTPATRTLTPAGASTISTSSSRMAATTISFRAASSRPDAATRKDSTRFVDTLITASPEFFKGKSPKEIAAYFQRAADFLIDRVGRRTSFRLWYTWMKKRPICTWSLCR